MQEAAIDTGEVAVSHWRIYGYMAVVFLHMRRRAGANLRSYASGQRRRPRAFTSCKVFRVVEQA
jgi:hypothetical protein